MVTTGKDFILNRIGRDRAADSAMIADLIDQVAIREARIAELTAALEAERAKPKDQT